MEKKTDIRAVDYEDYSMKVEINDAGKVVCCSEPKPTFVQIRIGDDWARFDNCASLQEFLDKVQEYGKLRKALDVAMECMQKCKTRDHIGAVCRTPEFVEEYERKISEIMKGGE